MRTLALSFSILFLSLQSLAGAGACESVFSDLKPQPLPTLELDFTGLNQQQSLVSLKFQKAQTVPENYVHNETMVDIALSLNRMLDPYVEALLFIKKHNVNAESRNLILSFLKANEVFFLSLLNNNKQALAEILNLRASVLEAERQVETQSRPIGFLGGEPTSSGTSQTKSIGFIEHSEAPAKPLESIGFIQPDKSAPEAPSQKLPSIGFVQGPAEVAPQQGSAQQAKTDVGYRLQLVIHPKFGYFDLVKPDALP